MIFTKTDIPDVWLIEPKVWGDDRGYFFESFRRDLFEKHTGRRISFMQDNESRSVRGVLRGLHYQLPPCAQSKLVRAVKGRIIDVAVDIRRGSPTFGRHVAVELSGENKHQLFIPRGFAHGFVVLSDDVIVQYKTDSYYSRECDRGIAFDDPSIGIDWRLPQEALRFSEKDSKQPLLQDAELFDYNKDLYL